MVVKINLLLLLQTIVVHFCGSGVSDKEINIINQPTEDQLVEDHHGDGAWDVDRHGGPETEDCTLAHE